MLSEKTARHLAQTLDRFSLADRALAVATGLGPDAIIPRATEYMLARREHQAAIEAADAELRTAEQEALEAEERAKEEEAL